MEEVTVLPKELVATPIKGGVSIINENPIGVLEKLGKYEFVYDYKVPNYWDNLSAVSTVREGGSNANMIATSGFYSGQSFPQPVKINSEAQVGFFSKGNIVNVIRFDGNNAIIENINYKAPDPTVVKTVWGELLGSVLNKKEFSVPKDYLRKADDTLEPTLLTGINYGANMKPQPVFISTPVKPIYDTTLEQNATFVLTKDFEYISGYGSSFCSPDGICTADMSPKYSTLKAGTKVSGRLFSKYIKAFSGGITRTSMPDIQQNVLEVKGYGSQGSIEIPIDYLTRFLVTVVSLVDKRIGKCNETGLIQTTEYNPCRVSAVKGEIYKGYIAGGSFYTTDGKTFIPINEYKIIEENSGVVVPAKNDNKNLLMIVGAFLVGYVVFSKGKSE
jgi:hypothetical protein